MENGRSSSPHRQSNPASPVPDGHAKESFEIFTQDMENNVERDVIQAAVDVERSNPVSHPITSTTHSNIPTESADGVARPEDHFGDDFDNDQDFEMMAAKQIPAFDSNPAQIPSAVSHCEPKTNGFPSTTQNVAGPSSVSLPNSGSVPTYNPIVEDISPCKNSLDEGIDYVKQSKGNSKFLKRSNESTTAVSRLVKAQKLVPQNSKSHTDKPREKVTIQRKSATYAFSLEGEYPNVLLKNVCLACLSCCQRISVLNLKSHLQNNRCIKMKYFFTQLPCGDYSCIYCSENTNDLLHLIGHIFKNHASEFIMCSYCSDLVRFDNLKNHMRDHLLQVSENEIECRKCRQIFPNANLFYLHIINSHNLPESKVTKAVIRKFLMNNDTLTVLAVTSKKTNCL